MTTFTERTLESTEFTERSLGAGSFTERSLDATELTERSLDAGSFTERAALDQTYFIGSNETETDQTDPVISNVHYNWVHNDSVEVDWDTNEPANCRVDISTHTPPWEGTEVDTGVTHEHYVLCDRSYEIDGLAGDTYHYIQIRSADVYGNEEITGFYKFKTAGAHGPGEVIIVHEA